MGASESKLAFKEDIFRLAGEPDIPADSPWWERFYQLPDSADDVFALWSPHDLRTLTGVNDPDRPRNTQTTPSKNIETLIYRVVARLDALQTRHVFPDPHTSIVPEVLNCVRILTRLLPYIYEAEHLTAWEEKFFWQPRKATYGWDKKYNRRSSLFDGLTPGKIISDADENTEIGGPLGEHLVDLLINYLFFPSFALPKKLDAEGKPDLHVSYSIWQSGIGCKQSLGMTKENERNAMEVLKLLLTLTSRTMYIPPNMAAQMDIRPLTYLTTKSSRQVVLSLICSLLNTVLKYNPASWRVPLDLSAVTKDPKQLLVTYSLQLMLVLVIYPAPNDEPNAFRKALSRLHRAEDFQFIQQGLTLILTQPVSGVASYMPSVSRALPWAPEMLVLFWELLQCNKRFRSFIIDTDRAHDFVVLILYYALEAKDDPTRQGIVRTCVFILQTLSVEPSFGMRLNKSFAGHESLPALLRIPNFHGSYADFLITTIHTLLTTTKGRLESIYPALLAIINNVAPYVRDLERATSSRLVDFFVSMSSPKFLLANETNHVLLASLLEAMNAILEHQLDANRRFAGVVVRSHKHFEALRRFTVDGALNELDRLTQERKDRGVDSSIAVSRSRQSSLDGLRNSNANRPASLENVPEHGAFSIGDDEESEDDESSPSNPSSRPQQTSSTRTSLSMEDALPVQSRSMSEKARGKQPVGLESFSRSTSRTASATSLSSINAYHTSHGAFVPTPEWLDSWLPHIPLHTILSLIDVERRRIAASKKSAHGSDGELRRATPAQNRPSSPSSERTEHELDVTVQSDTPGPPSMVKVQTFSWNQLALGWYLSMIWGFIYAQDTAANKGSNGLWTGTAIRLFNIQSQRDNISLRSPKGAIDAVGDSLARRVSGFSFSSAPSTREV